MPLTVAAPPGAPHSRCLVAASLAHPLQPSLLLFTANARGWVRTAVEAQRRRGDDDTTTNTRRRPRGDNDRAPISATEMLPPNRADAGTRRRGDDEAATTTASLPLQPRLTVAAAPTLTVAAVPRPSQKLQAPLQPQPRCCPKPSGALTVPAAALSHGPHCSPDPRGWVVEARTTTRRRRRDDQHWWSGRGRKGRRVTLISKAHSSVPNLGMGAQTADHWVQSAPKAWFLDCRSSRR